MTKDEKKTRVFELKDNWTSLFTALGLDPSKAYYYPKPVMKRNGKDPYVNFFPTEISRGEDIYTEPVDFNLNPEEKRKLYCLKGNPHYAGEYETMDSAIGELVIVPFAELVEVVMPVVTAPKPMFKTMVTISEDCNVSELTGKDWACIHLRYPGSDRSWLNDLITASKK